MQISSMGCRSVRLIFAQHQRCQESYQKGTACPVCQRGQCTFCWVAGKVIFVRLMGALTMPVRISCVCCVAAGCVCQQVEPTRWCGTTCCSTALLAAWQLLIQQQEWRAYHNPCGEHLLLLAWQDTSTKGPINSSKLVF